MLKTISSIATQIISSITGGLLQFTGPAAGTTRVITVPNANATMARTDSAQSFTGDQTLATGNLVIGTSGKGIDFSATPGTGTSELLADYEEGTWTPIATAQTGAITSYTSAGTYTLIGRQVVLMGTITITNAGTGTGGLKVTGFPFTYSTRVVLTGRETAVSGKGLTGSGFGTGLIVIYTDTLTPIATGASYEFTVIYSV